MTRDPIKPESNNLNMDHQDLESNKIEKRDTDQAWNKMQVLLKEEQPHPNWEKWTADDLGASSIPVSSNMKGMNTTMNSKKPTTNSSPSPAPTAHKKRRSFMSPTRRKWTTGIAACALLGTVLATPLGNNALAAIMNEFRMQEIASVDGEALDNMLDNYRHSESGNEDINRFGTFTNTVGAIEGEFSAKDAAEKLGYTYMDADVIGMDKGKQVYVSSARTQIIKLNVNEVNEAIQQMGGKEMLPQSMNQKEISFNLPASISYDLNSETATDTSKWASLTQSGVPTVKLDESIDAEEAYNALVNLPFMPNDMKSIMQKEKFLNGNIPLPIVSNSPAEKLTIDGVPVIITSVSYTNETSNQEENLYYRAYWIKDNQLFDLEGNKYNDRDDLKKHIEEMIQS